MNEQELYKLVESIVREELARRGAAQTATNQAAQQSPLLVVFT
jgi:hypothetical protein